MAKKRSTEFRPDDAKRICEAHEIDAILDNDEERALLGANNPELLLAYERLCDFAAGRKP
jgi:hypothetical protein